MIKSFSPSPEDLRSNSSNPFLFSKNFGKNGYWRQKCCAVRIRLGWHSFLLRILERLGGEYICVFYFSGRVHILQQSNFVPARKSSVTESICQGRILVTVSDEKLDVKEDRFYTLSHYRKRNNRLSPVWEDYLEMICRLSPRLEPVRIRDLAEALHVTPSSASRMAQSMAVEHLLDFQRYGYITLTETGKSMGAFLLRRHRVVCAFLEKLKGTADELEETELIEHGISEATVAAMERWLYEEKEAEEQKSGCTYSPLYRYTEEAPGKEEEKD